MARVLYHFEACPYCEKTRRALRYKGLDWRSWEVPPDDRSDVLAASGQSKVPVLVDNGSTVIDSTTIFAYLEDTYPEPPLYPRNPRDRALAGLVDEFADGPLHDVVHDVMRAMIRDEPAPGATADLRRYLEQFDSLLDGTRYLFGEQSLADMSVYAHLRFMLLHPEMPKGEDLPHFRAWVERMQAQGG